MNIERIVVPVDFSDPSLAALEYALEVFGPAVEIVLVYVVEPILPLAGVGMAGAMPIPSVALEESQVEEAKTRLSQLSEASAARCAGISHRVERGTPHTRIEKVAEEVTADLIVMATHGRSGLSHLLLGSVAEKVLRYSSCPVLTLRRSGE